MYTDDYGNVVIADDVTTDDTRVLIPNNTVSTAITYFLNYREIMGNYMFWIVKKMKAFYVKYKVNSF